MQLLFRVYQECEDTTLSHMVADKITIARVMQEYIRGSKEQQSGWYPYYTSDKSKYHIMQYTGLKDKNGKEIYENDIVRVLYTDRPSKPSDDTRTLEQYLVDKSTIMEVIFSQDSFCLQSYSGKYEDYNHSSILPGKHGFIEVIGNIYENPDLLIDSDYHLS